MRDDEKDMRGVILAVFFFNVLLLAQSLSTGMAHREITFIIFGLTFALGNFLARRQPRCAA